MAEETAHPGSQAGSGSQLGPARKKFATPPVKIACLSCRASRTRCDGGHPCANCQHKARDCVYKPSKRGGARVRRKPKLNDPAVLAQMQQMPQETLDVYQEPIAIENYIDPGAGLKQLNDWYQDSDFIFDSLFMGGVPNYLNGDGTFESMQVTPEIPPPPVPMVRTYKGDATILDAYYVFIHPYFPILPPPNSIPVDNFIARHQPQAGDLEDDFEPTSPIALAISAVLALIPCPSDLHHAEPKSLLFRRKYAQFLAQSAIERIESESELPESSTEPAQALQVDQTQSSSPSSAAAAFQASRSNLGDYDFDANGDFTYNASGAGPGSPQPPFHPAVPRELESVIALDILSVYEYAQRGNLVKMQSRAGQALVAAMALQLHVTSEEEDIFSEARRRVWWMTYYCISQAAIVSNKKPTFAVFSKGFTARHPTIQADPEAFTLFLQGQQAILAASQFVIELNNTVRVKGDMTAVCKRMSELELFLEPLIARAETWTISASPASTVEPSEGVVARALRGMARIKLNSARIKVHRYNAFFDIPIFSAKHCDLKAKPFSPSADSTSASTSTGTGADLCSPEQSLFPNCSCATDISPSGGSPSTASPAPGSILSSPRSDHNSHSSSTNSSIGGSSRGNGYDANFAFRVVPTPPVTTTTTTSPTTTLFPFSSHASAKICLRSALNIAADFDALPYPSPSPSTGADNLNNPLALPPPRPPRTMPSFACCAMQCAYSLLMVHERTKAVYAAEKAAGGTAGGGGVGIAAGGGGPPGMVGNLLVRLQQGLASISGTLENYSMAFEALGGMRDQVGKAINENSIAVDI